MQLFLNALLVKNIYTASILIFCTACLWWGCQQSQVSSIAEKPSYAFLAEDSTAYSFPRDAAGKIVVVGFIYTHCSGVCGMITNTMAEARRSLDMDTHDLSDKTGKVQFLSITFDPDRDTPDALRAYADVYTNRTDAAALGSAQQQQQSEWKFLSASQRTTDSVMHQFAIVARKTFTMTDSTNAPKYFLDHTDRILILTTDGTVWKEYEGSEVSAETILNDIAYLRKVVFARTH